MIKLSTNNSVALVHSISLSAACPRAAKRTPPVSPVADPITTYAAINPAILTFVCHICHDGGWEVRRRVDRQSSMRQWADSEEISLVYYLPNPA